MRYHSNTYEEGEWDVYWFEKNLLGDIIAVYASRGTKLIEYHYDAWGIFWTSYKNGGQNTTATKNSLGYRGYIMLLQSCRLIYEPAASLFSNYFIEKMRMAFLTSSFIACIAAYSTS
jgi:hypothetical protein